MRPDETTGCERCDYMYAVADNLEFARAIIARAVKDACFALGTDYPTGIELDLILRQLDMATARIYSDSAYCKGKPLSLTWIYGNPDNNA